MYWTITLCFVCAIVDFSTCVFRIDRAMKNQKIVPDLINIIRLKSDLANNYNQDIKRLKLEQESLKSLIDVELAKLGKNKLSNKTINEVDKKSSVAEEISKTNKRKVKIIAPHPPSDPETTPVDFGRLDLRVGKILNASKHPNADSLYVETIDVGEEKPRNVVSGLVKFVPLEELSNRMVILLCNLKPSKIRGVLSEAMVMCASSPDKVEILEPPQDAVPGDLINVHGFNRHPDKVLKVFEKIVKDLKTDDELRATYRGIPWKINYKGVVVTKSLKDVQIK